GSSGSFGDVVRPIVSVEPAVVNTTYDAGTGGGFDAGAGVRVMRHLAVGVDVSRFSKSGRASVSAQVPHPFYFNRARTVAGEAADLSRAETGVHVQVTWGIPLAARWGLAVFGGPSWFSVAQDVVSGVAVTESYPFDTADFVSAIASRRSASKIGFHAGADLAFMLRPRVGIGF